jgi:hypothetical protein
MCRYITALARTHARSTPVHLLIHNTPYTHALTNTNTQQFTLAIGGMSCAACSGKIERSVGAMPGVETCAVSLSTQVPECFSFPLFGL